MPLTDGAECLEQPTRLGLVFRRGNERALATRAAQPRVTLLAYLAVHDVERPHEDAHCPDQHGGHLHLHPAHRLADRQQLVARRPAHAVVVPQAGDDARAPAVIADCPPAEQPEAPGLYDGHDVSAQLAGGGDAAVPVLSSAFFRHFVVQSASPAHGGRQHADQLVRPHAVAEFAEARRVELPRDVCRGPRRQGWHDGEVGIHGPQLFHEKQGLALVPLHSRLHRIAGLRGSPPPGPRRSQPTRAARAMQRAVALLAHVVVQCSLREVQLATGRAHFVQHTADRRRLSQRLRRPSPSRRLGRRQDDRHARHEGRRAAHLVFHPDDHWRPRASAPSVRPGQGAGAAERHRRRALSALVRQAVDGPVVDRRRRRHGWCRTRARLPPRRRDVQPRPRRSEDAAERRDRVARRRRRLHPRPPHDVDGRTVSTEAQVADVPEQFVHARHRDQHHARARQQVPCGGLVVRTLSELRRRRAATCEAAQHVAQRGRCECVAVSAHADVPRVQDVAARR